MSNTIYIEDFLERNKEKPFFTNLKKYNELGYYGKCKCINSLLTHLFIDAEQMNPNDVDKLKENNRLQIELISIMNKIVLYKIDEFFMWLSAELEGNND